VTAPAQVIIMDALFVDGLRRPPERLYVDLSGPVGSEPTWRCGVCIDPEDRAKLQAADRAKLQARVDSVGVLAFLELFEWEPTDDELFALERFMQRGVEVVLPDVSDQARVLAQNDQLYGMELSLARGPVFGDQRDSEVEAGQLTLWREVGELHGRPFKVFEPLGPLHERDGLLIGHMIRLYADNGFADNRRFLLTFGAAGKAAGYATKGGKQRQLVKDALDRMVVTTFKAPIRDDGEIKELMFHICDWTLTSWRGDGSAVVTLSEPFAAQIRAGRLTYLERGAYARLMDADPKAARLWAFLETESLPTPRRYSLYPRPGQPPRDTPAIADLLRISRWKNRTNVWRRVQAACNAIMEVDQRYRLSVTPAARKTRPKMWNLSASRSGESVGRVVGTSGEESGYSQVGKWVLLGREVGTPGEGSLVKDLQNAPVSDSAVSLPSFLPSKERAGAAAPRLSQDSFATFWSAYPRQEQSHEDKASRAFAKLSDADQDATIRAAGHVAAAVAAGTLPTRYTWQPENFLRDVFRDWQDGPPAAYLPDQRKAGNLADVLDAGAQAFGLLTCYICGAALTPDDLAEETLTTHDGTGWRHLACAREDPATL